MSDTEETKTITSEKKGSFWKGFLISFAVMILMLIILGFVFRDAGTLGSISVYNTIVLFIIAFISKRKRLNLIKLIMFSVLFHILALIIGFITIIF